MRIESLIGMRAVVNLDGVVIAKPISTPLSSRMIEEACNDLRKNDADRPFAVVFDGHIRMEYGRPMDSDEIAAALVVLA